MSCRRGVPKNDCSCCKSLAEKVRELWERAANAIKTINGVQADGANNFDILPGAGIQVNPRANGIEIVATGAAPEDDSIKTINYVQPDEDGDFILRGGTGVDIEEIEDEEGINGLEISCTVEAPTYAAGDGIEIENDTISLKEWTLYDQTDWSIFKDANNKTTEDLLIVNYPFATGKQTFHYIPKGMRVPTSDGAFEAPIRFSDTGYEILKISLSGNTSISSNTYLIESASTSTTIQGVSYTPTNIFRSRSVSYQKFTGPYPPQSAGNYVLLYRRK